MSFRLLRGSEVMHILVAWLVLGFCFSVGSLNSNFFLLMFAISLLTVGLGFIFHELTHRSVARRFGYIARFRIWVWGLMMALILAIISGGQFIFAAPGAVYIMPSLRLSWSYSESEKRETGVISLAGPLVNMALGLAFLIISYFSGIIGIIGKEGFRVNFWLAAFNLLPFGPMDGRKVFRWSRIIWAIATVPAWIITFLPTYF